jgi:succinate-semialdehyde dehydrogenase/glutarate-semialdehyde dehydrogenase
MSSTADAAAVARAIGLSNPALISLDCADVNGASASSSSSSSSARVYFDVLNPATNETLCRVSGARADDIDDIIARADAAQKLWANDYTAHARGKIIRKWFALMEANAEDLARVMTAEQGKPLAESRGEVAYAASFLEWYAEEARRVYGDVVPASSVGSRITAIKQPVGTTAAITPWNFPLAMITRKAGAALAAGCSMVIKPSEETPLSAFALGVLAREAGCPEGVLQFVAGDAKAIGEKLCASPTVRKITFTGSTHVGKLLMRQSADTVKRISMELGGNAPFIVCDDADIDSAVRGAMSSKFRNSGQTCVCAQRFIVHERVVREFTEKLTAAARALVMGNGLENEKVTQGPLINAAHVDKVDSHVRDAVSKGAVCHTGGKRAHGNFYEPTVLSNCTQDMLVMREETFGPVAAIATFSDDDDAIRVANSTTAGLASYVYTTNVKRMYKFSEQLDFGIVGVNTGVISTAQAPFGGMKESGVGREGGKYGMDEYVETKYVCVGGLDE